MCYCTPGYVCGVPSALREEHAKICGNFQMSKEEWARRAAEERKRTDERLRQEKENYLRAIQRKE